MTLNTYSYFEILFEILKVNRCSTALIIKPKLTNKFGLFQQYFITHSIWIELKEFSRIFHQHVKFIHFFIVCENLTEQI